MKCLGIYSTGVYALFLPALIVISLMVVGDVIASTFDESIFQSTIIRELSAEDLPGQCAIVLLNRMEHRFDFEKTVVEWERAVKILTREGIEKYGNFVTQYYDSKAQKYSVIAAVYSPNGKKKEVSKSDKKIVQFGNNYFQYRIAFPRLEIGSIIFIQQILESNDPITMGHWDFSETIPTLSSELVFQVPKGVDVDFIFTPKNSGFKGDPVTVDEKYDAYNISMDNVSPFKHELIMPANNINNPSVDYYIWGINRDDRFHYEGITGNDRERLMIGFNKRKGRYADYRTWSNVGRVYAGYFNPYKKDETGGAENFVESLELDKIEDFVRDINKIKRAFHERYKLLPEKISSSKENPENIFTRGEGTPLQIAYAFKLILSKMHIASAPVLIKDISKGVINQTAPTCDFRDALLLVETSDNEKYWIAPSCPECGVNEIPWEEQGIKALLVRSKDKISFIVTPMNKGELNCLKTKDVLSIKKNGVISGIAYVTLTGQYLIELRRKAGMYSFELRVEDIGKVLEDWLPYNYENSELSIESESRDSLMLSYEYSMQNAVKTTGAFLKFDISPWCYEPISEAFQYDKRQYDIVVPFLSRKEATLIIELPEGCSLIEKPQSVRLKSESFDFLGDYYTKGNTLIYMRRFIAKSNKISADIYQEEKKLIDRMKQIEKESIIIKTGP